MTTQEAVSSLRRFIKQLVSDRISNIEQFRQWKQEPDNAAFMAECLGYKQLDGMPSVTAVVQPFFHPSQPLIGLGYTQVAHVTLHKFASDGWTPAIRLCRGIIFDRRGTLVAMPFPKFFNYGESPETNNLPNEPFEATLKNDGHLGILFEYKGGLFITTRGCFVSKTAVVATQMLDAYREKWRSIYPKDVTTLVEIIHPETHVIVDYGDAERFVVIGAFNRRTLKDSAYPELTALAKHLSLPVADLWQGTNVSDLAQLMYDLSVKNEEGYVVRFASGLRVKFKYKAYIGLMLMEKLNVRWVMARLQENSLERRRSDLPGEVQLEIDRLRDQLLKIKEIGDDRQKRLDYLVALEPDEEERTPYYRGLCSKFDKWLFGPPPKKAAKPRKKSAKEQAA